VLPDGRHFKNYYLVHEGDGAERLMVTAEDSVRKDRRYTYKAVTDVGGFCFENGKAVSGWGWVGRGRAGCTRDGQGVCVYVLEHRTKRDGVYAGLMTCHQRWRQVEGERGLGTGFLRGAAGQSLHPSSGHTVFVVDTS
jgi:hypothetical protein